jgi:mannose-6-phosphate isomerase-like protein (cupin superfamily)
MNNGFATGFVMTHRSSSLTVACGGAALLFASLAAMAAEPPPAATPAGGPATYVGRAATEAKLAASVAAAKDPATGSVIATDQYTIVSVRRVKAGAPPAIHPGWTELHMVTDGSATFVTGGKIVTPAGATSAVIEGGVSRKIEKGDTVIVPANTPHWYQQIDGGGISAVEVRFIAPPVADAAK